MKRACHGRSLIFLYKMESGQQCCGFASRWCGSYFLTLMRIQIRNLPFTLIWCGSGSYHSLFPDLDPPTLQNNHSTLMRILILLFTLIRIRIQLSTLMRIRIQIQRMMRIHADSDPQHCRTGPGSSWIQMANNDWHYARGTNTVPSVLLIKHASLTTMYFASIYK